MNILKKVALCAGAGYAQSLELGKIVHPGQLSLPNGWSCNVDVPFGDLEQAAQACSDTVLELLYMPSLSQARIKDMLVSSEEGYLPGCTMGVELAKYSIGGKPVFVHIPSDEEPRVEMQNFIRAARFAKNSIREITANSSIEDVIKFILELHRNLTDSLDGASPGKFRGDEDGQLVVFYDQERKALDDFITILKEKRVKKKYIAHFKKVLKKGGIAKCLENKACKKLFHKYIAAATPNAVDVPSLMEDFTKELKEGLVSLKSDQTFDGLLFAATMHQRLVAIHPFSDGNGRTARMLMNSILEICGHSAIVILDDLAYTKAINKDLKDPEAGIFRAFINKIVSQQSEPKVEFEVEAR